MVSTAGLKAALVNALPDSVVFRVSPWLYRRQEPELELLRTFVPPNKTVVDIGGWLGPWTRELARWSQHVHTFEPQPDLAAYLRRVVPKNVTVYECALSDSPGIMPLFLPSERHGSNALASLNPMGIDESDQVRHDVEVIRLDSLDLGDVAFMKVDVEGHETEVLAGASGIIEASQPRLLLEAEQRHLRHPVTNLFESLAERGYDGWFLIGGEWQKISTFNVEQHQMAHLDNVLSPDYINNFLFVPAKENFKPSAR